jgi:GNAT superfamily N-acetyltransferase
MTVRTLEPTHVEAALRLSAQAGWNQVAEDWLRLIRLWPGQCLGAWVDDRLIATGTLATYPSDTGSVGWVGMILVDERHRGRGHGTAMMDAILKLADERHVDPVGLDASDQGEPIYRRLGFEACADINRWRGRAAIDDSGIDRPDGATWGNILRLDRAAVRADRQPLLSAMAADAAADLRWVNDGDSVRGYGFVRRGRLAWHVGPVVAVDTPTASRVLDELIGTPLHKPWTDVFVDVFAGSPMEAILLARGFAVSRRLRRMCLGATGRPPLTGEQVFGAAGFELG